MPREISLRGSNEFKRESGLRRRCFHSGHDLVWASRNGHEKQKILCQFRIDGGSLAAKTRCGDLLVVDHPTRRSYVSLTLEQKKRVVAEVNEIAAGAQAVIAAEYSGLSVSDMTELRVNARNDGVTIRVVKNSFG